MKKLTPLQELIEWINFIEHKYGGDGISHIKTKATELLEEEKQEIEDAYNKGAGEEYKYQSSDCTTDVKTSEQYFTDTYETK
jgi:hypothetical protein